MPRPTFLLPAVLTSLGALSMALACGGGDGARNAGPAAGAGGAAGAANTDAGTGGAGLSPGAAGGPGGAPSTGAALGAACTDDSSCAEGLRCVEALLSGTDRYCSNPCTSNTDCAELERTSYTFQVPLQYTRFLGEPATNVWNSEYLGRGSACAPIGGQDGQPSVCQFACGNFAAAVVEGGQVAGCICLPGYTPADDGSTCIPEPGVECSLFNFMDEAAAAEVRDKFGINASPLRCDACNSDMTSADIVNCHTGRFTCAFYNRSFEGECTEVFSSDEFMNCAQSQIYQTCDCQCPDVSACGGSPWSLDCACCTCGPSSAPPPRPVCNPGAGTGGAPNVGGSGNGGSPVGNGGSPVGNGGSPVGNGGAPPASCTAPPDYGCGTDSIGTTPCPTGQVCCLSPGCSTAPNPYEANGVVSRCFQPTSTPNSFSSLCAIPAIQLCAVDADCAPTHRCDPGFYCVLR